MERLNYEEEYRRAGRLRDGNGGMDIPLFTCGHCFGDSYARSVSFGLSRIFPLKGETAELCEDEVYQYLLSVCSDEDVCDEDCNQIFNEVARGLARENIAVFALSYKHRIRGGDFGRRQRLSNEGIRVMARNIVRHASSSYPGKRLCFWLDQILGQRLPSAERKWVENGLLPYAVFHTIVFAYKPEDKGAWLTVESLLASGRSPSSAPEVDSMLIRRGANEGGPDSLMRAASAVACGVIDDLRGNKSDIQSLVEWSLRALDIVSYGNFNQDSSSLSLFPFRRRNFNSILFNLEILPGELTNKQGPWRQEASLLSKFVPPPIIQFCDGSFMTTGTTLTYLVDSTDPTIDRFLYIQVVTRNARPELVIAALLTQTEDPSFINVLNYMASSFDVLTDSRARSIQECRANADWREGLINWEPVQHFVANLGLQTIQYKCKFDGIWVCDIREGQ